MGKSHYDFIRTLTGDQLVEFFIQMPHNLDLMQPVPRHIVHTRLDSLEQFKPHISPANLVKLCVALDAMPSPRHERLVSSLSEEIVARTRAGMATKDLIAMWTSVASLRSAPVAQLCRSLEVEFRKRILAGDMDLVMFAVRNRAGLPPDMAATLVALATSHPDVMSSLMAHLVSAKREEEDKSSRELEKSGTQDFGPMISDCMGAMRFFASQVPSCRILPDDATPEQELMARLWREANFLEGADKRALSGFELNFKGLVSTGVVSVSKAMKLDRGNKLMVWLNMQPTGPDEVQVQKDVRIFRQVLAEKYRPAWEEPANVNADKFFVKPFFERLQAIPRDYFKCIELIDALSASQGLLQKEAQTLVRDLRRVADDRHFRGHRQDVAAPEVWVTADLERADPQARLETLKERLATVRLEFVQRIAWLLAGQPEAGKKHADLTEAGKERADLNILMQINPGCLKFLAIAKEATSKESLTQREAEILTEPLKKFAQNPDNAQDLQRWGGDSNPLSWDLGQLAPLSRHERPYKLRKLLEPATEEVKHRIVYQMSVALANVDKGKSRVARTFAASRNAAKAASAGNDGAAAP